MSLLPGANPAIFARLAQGAFVPIDFADLNEDQLKAVKASEGPALVLAGAGSGKTLTLTYRVAWLLEQGLNPQNILLLTFTNKAAREMLRRVEELTGVPHYKFWGGTFHSVGQRFLRHHGDIVGIPSNFTILDEGDTDALMADVVRRVDPSFTKHKEHPKPKVIHDLFSYTRNTRQPLSLVIADKLPWLAEIGEQLQRFYTAFQQAKLERSVCDYDDLLEHWLRVLQKDESVRTHYQQRFRQILVDEYQDTNKLQSEIVDLLASQHQIMAVGDDAQCIYTFRGANFDNIRLFPERHPGAQIFKIEINYRSTPEILRFANGILDHQHVAKGFHKHLRAVCPSKRKPVVIAALDTKQQAQLVLRRILNLHEREGVPLCDIAVLYRAHYQAMDLQFELSHVGLPFTITSGVRFFEQSHVRDLVAHLRFAHNPRDTMAFIRLVSLLPKVGARKAESARNAALNCARSQGKTLIDVLTDDAVAAKLPAEARGDFKNLALSLQNLAEALTQTGAAPLHPEIQRPPGEIDSQVSHFDDDFSQVPSASSPLPAPRAKPDQVPQSPSPSVPSPSDIVQLAIDRWYGDYLRNLHDNWQSRRDELDSIVSFAARFEDMNEFLAQLVLLTSETGDLSAEPHADMVRLTTIHQAKGLEFPVVFLIGAADGLLPLQRAIEEGDVEEERRLFYVASTRAKDELLVLYPRIVTQGGPPAVLEPSRFLNELDPDSYGLFNLSGMQ